MCFKTTDITVNKENFKENIKNIIKQYYKEEYDEKISTDYFNAQTIKQLIRHACRLQPMVDTKSEFMQIEKDNPSYVCFTDPVLYKLDPVLHKASRAVYETPIDEYLKFYLTIHLNDIATYCSSVESIKNINCSDDHFYVDNFLTKLKDSFLDQRNDFERFWLKGEQGKIDFKLRKYNETNNYGVIDSESSSENDIDDMISYSQIDEDDNDKTCNHFCVDEAEEDNNDESLFDSQEEDKTKKKKKKKKNKVDEKDEVQEEEEIFESQERNDEIFKSQEKKKKKKKKKRKHKGDEKDAEEKQEVQEEVQEEVKSQAKKRENKNNNNNNNNTKKSKITLYFNSSSKSINNDSSSSSSSSSNNPRS